MGGRPAVGPNSREESDSWPLDRELRRSIEALRVVGDLCACQVRLEGLLAVGLGVDLTIRRVADRLDLDRSSVGKHLALLNQAGVLELTRRGRETVCRTAACTEVEFKDEVTTVSLRLASNCAMSLEMPGSEAMPDMRALEGVAARLSMLCTCARRFQVVWFVAMERPRSVRAVAAAVGQSEALASHHLTCLREGGLLGLRPTRHGHAYRLGPLACLHQTAAETTLRMACRDRCVISMQVRNSSAVSA